MARRVGVPGQTAPGHQRQERGANSPLARETAPTMSACVGEMSNEATKTNDVADDTPINAACGPNSTSSPAPNVQMTTSGKMATPRIPQ